MIIRIRLAANRLPDINAHQCLFFTLDHCMFQLIGKWFNRYRGLAIGISSMGIGVGTMLMATLAGYIVKHYGWRNGFLLIGLLMLSMGILISYFFNGVLLALS